MSYRVLDLSSFALFWTDKRTRTPPSIACHRSPQKWPRSQVKLSSNYLVIGIDLRYHGQESLRLAVVLRVQQPTEHSTRQPSEHRTRSAAPQRSWGEPSRMISCRSDRMRARYPIG